MRDATHRVVFRADSTASIGAGHLMRCFGLAQYMRDQGVGVRLVTTEPADRFVEAWREEGIAVEELVDVSRAGEADARSTGRTAAGALVVLDGYDFGADYVGHLRGEAGPVALFDDLNDHPIAADVVINQNAGAERRVRYGLPNGVALLGCEYVVLRRNIRHARHQGGGGVLVTLGGGDIENVGLRALRLLASARVPVPVHLICTSDASGLAEAEKFCAQTAGFSVSPAGEILDLMLRADTALCAGGTTSLELAHLGVPMSILVRADNQAPGAAAVAEAGAAMVSTEVEAAVDALPALLADRPRRDRMAAAGRALVDGEGVRRITETLLSQVARVH